MRNKMLYSAIFNGDYPFKCLFKEVTTIIDPTDLKDLNSVLVIWGGGDISPSLYGHGLSKHTGASLEPSHRDSVEWSLAVKAVELGIPILGICRGAQILCALAKGFLIQDITGHTSSHEIVDLETNQTLIASSLHHQMMFPWGLDHKMIAVSKPSVSKNYLVCHKNDTEDQLLDNIPSEPEVVWFPKVKGLAIQGHPEFLGINHPYVKYCFNLVETYL